MTLPLLIERFCWQLKCRLQRQHVRIPGVNPAPFYRCAGCGVVREFSTAGEWHRDSKTLPAGPGAQAMLNALDQARLKKQALAEYMRNYRVKKRGTSRPGLDAYLSKRVPGHKHRGRCGKYCFKEQPTE